MNKIFDPKAKAVVAVPRANSREKIVCRIPTSVYVRYPDGQLEFSKKTGETSDHNLYLAIKDIQSDL